LAETGVKLSLNLLAFGFLASLVSSYLTVSFLMRFFVNNTLRPFGVYLVLLGVIVSIVGFVY
jgi:undecaprenyl pyrophosphate phosphatase UppP